MNYIELSTDDQDAICDQLAEALVSNHDSLVWDSIQETRVMTIDSVQRCYAEDVVAMMQLIRDVYQGIDLETKTTASLMKIAKEQIDEALADYDAMPNGFYLAFEHGLTFVRKG